MYNFATKNECSASLTPLFGSSSVAKMVKIGFNLFRKILKVNGVNDVRAPLEPRASLIVGAPFALHAPQASVISLPGDGLGVSKIGHFQTVN